MTSFSRKASTALPKKFDTSTRSVGRRSNKTAESTAVAGLLGLVQRSGDWGGLTAEHEQRAGFGRYGTSRRLSK